ncbi:MAG: hypothetical protein A2275_00040 [Bacteroidetes bacterium RIFOXYA12_FULL_35_11]|nr:MAG: hypothetical protein A2275_00040 [Bacteroidetes bacterium RIFOXYA12_FULL_35_11]
MLRFTLCLLLLLWLSTGFSQNYSEYYVNPDNSTSTPKVGNPVKSKADVEPVYDKRPFTNDKRVKVAFQTGASFSSFGNSSLFNTWVAPEVQFQVSPKFKLKVGTVAMYSMGSALQDYLYNENTTDFSNRLAQYYLYAQGEYKINDRLRLRAATIQETPNNVLSSQRFSMNRFGIDWKIKDKVFLSADIQLAQGRSPYGTGYYNPYYSQFNNGPFSGVGSSFSYAGSSFGSAFGSGW